jgi:hypothetical protein
VTGAFLRPSRQSVTLRTPLQPAFRHHNPHLPSCRSRRRLSWLQWAKTRSLFAARSVAVPLCRLTGGWSGWLWPPSSTAHEAAGSFHWPPGSLSGDIEAPLGARCWRSPLPWLGLRWLLREAASGSLLTFGCASSRYLQQLFYYQKTYAFICNWCVSLDSV